MTGTVNSRELLRFVVRISRPDGATLGTGFFAAPGWVVTCAHVVKDLPEVTVTPANLRIGIGQATWRVAARSDAPPAGWGSAFWPYPDLAVLRADDSQEHPCPLLEPRDPAGEHECHSWGYALREPGIEPLGSPASFSFEGVEGDGFLRLKAGQAAPGLSGSPLVCPSRRAVVGVVAVSRDTRSDLGGWATPISALMLGGEGVPAALAEAGEAIRSANRAGVIRFRREWNTVLPVDTDGMLGQPWAEFRRGPRSAPSSLLRADFGVMPYLFRDAELAEAEAWCQGADWATPMSIMQVTAPGGAGKTRFAIELCKRLAPTGWAAGLWHGEGEIAKLPLPRLVVIDYAEEAQAASLRDGLDALGRHATGLAPVQVLMLSRARAGQASDAVTELGKDAPATLVRVLDHLRDNPVAARPLPVAQRQALYREAVSSFITAWCSDAQTGAEVNDGSVPDLSHDRYEVALEVLFEALVAALNRCDEGAGGELVPADGDSGHGRSAAEGVLEHEEKYWQLTTPAAFRGDGVTLRECAGLATLAGAGDQDEADALLSIPARLARPDAALVRRDLIGWLSSMYDGPGTLNPIRPDRLGEELVCRVLADQDDKGRAMLGAVLRLESDDQAERCLDVLARIGAYDRPTALTAAAVVSRLHADLTVRAEEQSHGAPGRPGRTALAGACQRLLTPRFCVLVERALADDEPGSTTYRRDLSVSFERLADLAREAGQGERARELYERSLEIAQGLADDEPGSTTYRRDLSVSFNKLADLAREAGQGERARELYERSLEIRQGLADDEPGSTTYRRDLSVSFERLADLAREAGQGDDARQWVSRALDIRRGLVRDEPGRLDLVVELAYVLYLWAEIGAEDADPSPAREAIRLLEPFERLGYVTPRALALLAWARQVL